MTTTLAEMPALMFPQAVIDREVAKFVREGSMMWDMARATADALVEMWRDVMACSENCYGHDPVYNSEDFYRWKSKAQHRTILYEMAVALEKEKKA